MPLVRSKREVNQSSESENRNEEFSSTKRTTGPQEFNRRDDRVTRQMNPSDTESLTKDSSSRRVT